jgi:gliding motility-associated protein GldC
MKTNELVFRVTVDENNLPVRIDWDAGGGQTSECRSVMVALWDAKENNTLRMDLWTKEMSVDEMKKFFHQNVVTLADTYIRATGDDKVGNKVKQVFNDLGKEMGVLTPGVK